MRRGHRDLTRSIHTLAVRQLLEDSDRLPHLAVGSSQRLRSSEVLPWMMSLLSPSQNQCLRVQYHHRTDRARIFAYAFRFGFCLATRKVCRTFDCSEASLQPYLYLGMVEKCGSFNSL